MKFLKNQNLNDKKTLYICHCANNSNDETAFDGFEGNQKWKKEKLNNIDR